MCVLVSQELRFVWVLFRSIRIVARSTIAISSPMKCPKSSWIEAREFKKKSLYHNQWFSQCLLWSICQHQCTFLSIQLVLNICLRKRTRSLRVVEYPVCTLHHSNKGLHSSILLIDYANQTGGARNLTEKKKNVQSGPYFTSPNRSRRGFVSFCGNSIMCHL